MIILLRKFLKNLPTLIIAFSMALASWIAAVSSTDPNEIRAYPIPVEVEILGQNPQTIIPGSPLRTVRVMLNAPRSIWTQLSSQSNHIRAFLDLSGLEAGTYQVPVQVQVDLQPVKIVSVSPDMMAISMDKLVTQDFPLELIKRGEPAIGYAADVLTYNPHTIKVSGPASTVQQVKSIRAVLDLSDTQKDIAVNLSPQVLDVSGENVEGLNILPETIAVNQKIIQKGGYRNVVIKVITTGRLANGYRLTDVSVYPSTITVYSASPEQVDALPGYVETKPVNLDNEKSDINQTVELNLPVGITLVGDQPVTIAIGITAIESSVTYSRITIQIEGLADGLKATISPESVDVILSGPLPVLDRLIPADLLVTINLEGKVAGTYQVTPVVSTSSSDIQVESILPATIEVVVQSKTSINP